MEWPDLAPPKRQFEYCGHHDIPCSGSLVIPGRCDASNPESRNSGSGASAPARNDGPGYPLPLIQNLAQRDIALLLLGPVASAGDGAVNHEVVSVDEGGFVAGEKHRGASDILGQPGTL